MTGASLLFRYHRSTAPVAACVTAAALVTLLALPATALAETPHRAAKKAAASALPSDAFFDPTAVQDIRLVMKADDWATLRARFMSDDYYPADFQWNGQTVATVGIRSRGHGSRNPFKPGIKIEFEHYITDQKFLGMRSLALLNGVQDPSMVRQRLGMAVFDKMGEAAPRTVHARVFVNGEYVGLYQSMEAVDKNFLTRTMGLKDDGEPDKDGYLYQYLGRSGFEFEYPGDDYSAYAAMFDAQTHEHGAPADLWGPMADTFKALNTADDASFEREVGKYVDLPKFARFLAVETCTADIDGILGDWGIDNFYYYRHAAESKAQFIPWDKDTAFYAWDGDIFRRVGDNVLAKRVLSVPSYYQSYLNTLIACGQALQAPESADSTVGWLESELRRERAQITPAAYADPNKRFDNDRFNDELDKLTTFAQKRGGFVIAEALKALEKLSYQ
jgi:spore coat protein CotH